MERMRSVAKLLDKLSNKKIKVEELGRGGGFHGHNYPRQFKFTHPRLLLLLIFALFSIVILWGLSERGSLREAYEKEVAGRVKLEKQLQELTALLHQCKAQQSTSPAQPQQSPQMQQQQPPPPPPPQPQGQDSNTSPKKH